MSRHCGPNKNVEPILKAAEHWKEVALLSDRGIFENKQGIWKRENFEVLDKNIIKNIKEGEGHYEDKLEEQLKSTQSEIKQLASEMHWFLLLCPSNILESTKVKRIKNIWEWSDKSFPEDSESKWLSPDVLCGIGSGGRGFSTNIWREFFFLIRLMLALKKLSVQQRESLLSDGWKLAEWLEQIDECDSRQLRHMLLFLLFPDNFERIFSGEHRIKIVCAFTGEKEAKVRSLSALELDKKISKIRKDQEEINTPKLDFYFSPLKEIWQEEETGKNLILYGPPGTGKTYWIRKRSEEKYWSKAGKPNKKTYLDKELSEARWVDVIFGVLHDRNKKMYVNEIFNHNYIRIKSKAVGNNNQHIIETIWGILRRHTETIGNKTPVVFDRKPDDAWVLRNGWEKEYPNMGERAQSWKTVPTQGANEKRFEFVTFHQAYSYEDFVEGIRPDVNSNEETENVRYEIVPGVFKRICQKARIDPRQRYAIFIDEINRGNIASIFGELITLIETDKRVVYEDSGKPKSEGMMVTLPYSGELFGVPANLDIYGSMNTADRSIALLDTALRRRFEFKELMPDTSVIKGSRNDGRIEEEGGTIDLRALLEAVNLRIRLLLNRNMTIGHSYLINVRSFADLKKVLLSQIIPLLQEYFYKDWKKIQMVLGKQVIVSEQPNTKVFGDDYDFEEKPEYHVVDEKDITPDKIRKIYEYQESN